MNRPPLVSIIIPCFNCSVFVNEALESAINQTYKNKEIIVVNDGSTDNSQDILEQYKNIHIIQQKNKGVSEARNSAIRLSKGEFIAFLDSDDYWDTDFLVEMVKQAKKTGTKLVYCGWEHVGNYIQAPFIPPDYESMNNKLEVMIEAPRWPVHAAIVHRAIVEKIGGFDETLNYCEDFYLWIRAATENKITRVAKVLAYYRHHGTTQLSQSILNMAYAHLQVQQTFLHEHKEIKKQLTRKQIRKITYGRLLAKAYEYYWKRELTYARPMFREVLRHGYGGFSDLKYMLPSLLPLSWHKKLISELEKGD